MKSLIAGILIVYAGFAEATLLDERVWAFNVSHFWEDRCYTTNTEECKVEGNEIRVRRDSERYFITASYSRFRSAGDQLVGELFELGVGDRFAPTQATSATIRAMLNIEPDESQGANGANSNFNKGYSLDAALSTRFSEVLNKPMPVDVGIGLTYEDKQNCSHPDCHELGVKKGRMELVQATLFFKSPLRGSDLSLTSSISQIVVYPRTGSMNGRRQDEPTVRIGLEYRPGG